MIVFGAVCLNFMPYGVRWYAIQCGVFRRRCVVVVGAWCMSVHLYIRIYHIGQKNLNLPVRA